MRKKGKSEKSKEINSRKMKKSKEINVWSDVFAFAHVSLKSIPNEGFRDNFLRK